MTPKEAREIERATKLQRELERQCEAEAIIRSLGRKREADADITDKDIKNKDIKRGKR